jgi:hypothetical protein
MDHGYARRLEWLNRLLSRKEEQWRLLTGEGFETEGCMVHRA